MHILFRMVIRLAVGMMLYAAVIPAELPRSGSMIASGTSDLSAILTSISQSNDPLSDTALELQVRLLSAFPAQSPNSNKATQAIISYIQKKFTVSYPIAAAYLGTVDAYSSLRQKRGIISLDTFLEAARVFDGSLKSDDAITLLAAAAHPIMLNTFFCNELSIKTKSAWAPLELTDTYTLNTCINNDATYYSLECRISSPPGLKLKYHSQAKNTRPCEEDPYNCYIDCSKYCNKIIPMGVVEQPNHDIACVGHAMSDKKKYFFLCRMSQNRTIKQFMKYFFDTDLKSPECIVCINPKSNQRLNLIMDE